MEKILYYNGKKSTMQSEYSSSYVEFVDRRLGDDGEITMALVVLRKLRDNVYIPWPRLKGPSGALPH